MVRHGEATGMTVNRMVITVGVTRRSLEQRLDELVHSVRGRTTRESHARASVGGCAGVLHRDVARAWRTMTGR